MSTRSNIAIEAPKTKKVKVIYVHSDGYPYGVGKCLVDNYNNRQLAEELFKYGDASYLGDTLDECSFYSRDWNRNYIHLWYLPGSWRLHNKIVLWQGAYVDNYQPGIFQRHMDNHQSEHILLSLF